MKHFSVGELLILLSESSAFDANNDCKGTVISHASEFYSSRVPKRQRGQNITEELMKDSEFTQYAKNQYKAIQTSKVPRKKRKKKH